jgi:hypothetical protein
MEKITIGYLTNKYLLAREVFFNSPPNTRVSDIVCTKLDRNEIKHLDLKTLFYEAYNFDEGVFDQINKYYPVIPADEFTLNEVNFQNSENNRLLSIHSRSFDRWLLMQNINTVDQIFSLTDYLKDLWLSDKQNFYKELWYILKSNMGSYDLKIIYQDLIDSTSGKEKLGFLSIEGNKDPEFIPFFEPIHQIGEEYKAQLTEEFKILEYDNETLKFAGGLLIGTTPVLMMGHLNQINKLQTAVISSVFDGINKDIIKEE